MIITVFASNKSKAHVAIGFLPICGAKGLHMENRGAYEYRGGLLHQESLGFHSAGLGNIPLEQIIDCKKCLKRFRAQVAIQP